MTLMTSFRGSRKLRPMPTTFRQISSRLAAKALPHIPAERRRGEGKRDKEALIPQISFPDPVHLLERPNGLLITASRQVSCRTAPPGPHSMCTTQQPSKTSFYNKHTSS